MTGVQTCALPIYGRGPQITTSDLGTIIAAVDSKGNIFSWKQASLGKWVGVGTINNKDTTAKEGFVSLTATQNNFYATWLDLRTGNNQIYIASLDTSGEWKNKLLYTSPDTTVCECCKPNIFADATGTVHVMWRNWLKGSRDMYLSSFREGSTPTIPQKLGMGTWKLKGCPMDGGGLSATTSGQVVSVWRRGDSLYIAEPGFPEQAFAKGIRPVIAYSDNFYLTLWEEGKNVVGKRYPDTTKIVLGEGKYPQLASSTKIIVSVWEGPDNQIFCRTFLKVVDNIHPSQFWSYNGTKK